MDLPQIDTVVLPRSRADLPAWRDGAAFLGGGTWLFSEPQPDLRSLVDLTSMAWPPLEPSAHGLRIAATCTIATLEAFAQAAAWIAAPVIGQCCQSLLGSFKIAGVATVGGNVCLSLPAAPMVALTVALEGVATIWSADGNERKIAMQDFTIGAQRTVLMPGDVLRAIDIPAVALQRRTAARQASLTRHGRSAALLVGSVAADGFALTITAATPRPVRRHWPQPPTPGELDAWVCNRPDTDWYDDVHGDPAWRRHMTRRLAAELLAELHSELVA